MSLEGSSTGMIGVVINHYNPGLDRKLTYQALHCVGAYLAQSVPVLVVLSDGSGIVDPILEREAAQTGFHYVPSARRLYFAEGYNAGIAYVRQKLGSECLVTLSANDLFPAALALHHLRECLLSEDWIGCAIPYLSHSDFRVQSDTSYPKRRLLKYMTLNLNLFRMIDLVAIGEVPTAYSGYFNDIVMALKLGETDKRVALCYGGKVFHQHRSTTSVSSLSSFERDKAQFLREYPWLGTANPRRPLALSRLTGGFWSVFYSIWEMRWASSFQSSFIRMERLALKLERWFFRNVYFPVYLPLKGKKMEDPYKEVR
jgi:GT2 family glycosyltransferase